MKMYDINGDVVPVDIRQSSYPLKGDNSRSKIQNMVSIILQELYPRQPILEEFSVPGSRLKIDFYLPKSDLLVEVDGIQHDEFTPVYHGSKTSSNKFVRQNDNDGLKNSWATVNNLTLIRIKHDDDEQSIRSKLSG